MIQNLNRWCCTNIIRAIFGFFNRKKVNPIANTKRLNDFISHTFSEFHKYCLSEEIPISGIPVKEFIQPQPKGTSYEEFEFQCLGWSFVIQKLLFPFECIAYLKTYQIVKDENDYPQKKLKHIEEMDIVIKQTTPTAFRFVKNKTAELPVLRNQDGTISTVSKSISEIVNFNNQYVNWLYTTLQERYKHPEKIG